MSWIWKPGQQWIEQTNAWRMMQRLGIETREEFLRWSVDHLEEFWAEMVRETGIHFSQPYQQVLDTSGGVEWAKWFTGGKINIAENCLTRHVGSANPAIIWEGEDGTTRVVTFDELQTDVNGMANHLRSLWLDQGDRVALCMPMVPEAVTILYACFQLGLVAVPIFAGFGAGAIATRLQDSGARAVFTVDHLVRRGKRIPLAEKVAQAIEKAESPATMIVARYGQPFDFAGASAEGAALPLDSETPAMILYTSGTTGKPKGTVHTHAGTLAQMAKEIYLAFDHKPDDRFFWLTDIGWMMGPWSIIGNHNFGGTIFLYDGAPDYPRHDRLWETIERHRITTFGISPTAIRLLMRSESSLANSRAAAAGIRSGAPKQKMSSLRLLGSTGEPWDDTSYQWFFDKIGHRRCPIINISGGTEIVGCFLFPLPIQALKSCTVGAPAPGMAAEIVDDAGRPVPPGTLGYLVCTKPAPSMTRGIWNDPERYIETYWSRWPGIWNHGDWASVDEDGCWFLHGRADESMNVAGRKVGPAEVEDALMEHPAVSEAAVIGVPDELKGETIVAFVVLRNPVGADAIAAHLVESLGPTFRPKEIIPVRELPKTQSGKIVRRLMRLKYLGEELGDVSTVMNVAALDDFGR